MKEKLLNPIPQSIHWSDDRWKACLAAGGGAKGDSSVVLMIQEQLFISELVKDIQDARGVKGCSRGLLRGLMV